MQAKFDTLSDLFIEKSDRVQYYLFMSEENYVKASEVAKRYDVKPVTVKAWIKQGLLPNSKFEETIAGSIWLISESDLKHFIKPEMGRPKKQ